jgi:hypothetical protein
MPYGLIYQLRYKDQITEEVIRVNICKTSTFDPGATTVTVALEGYGSKPFGVSVIDNNRDKLTPIRAKEAKITLLPSSDYTAATFATGPDNEWFVEAYVESTSYYLFKGFLIIDDIERPFLPTSHQKPFTLTAIDQLGTLKDIELKDLNGDRIDDVGGKHSLLDYLLFALKPTGLDLNVVICSTWFEESQTAFETAWKNIYVSHKTFEDSEINKKVDCYNALEIILETFMCTLFQRNGKWWIRSIDEPTSGPLYGFEYDWDGTFIGDLNSTSYVQTIGRTEDINFINEDAYVNYTRPIKTGRINYTYRFPLELIDNSDFSRGTDDLLPIVVNMGLYISSHTNLGAFPATGQHTLTYKANDTSFYYKWTGTAYEQLTGSEVPSGTAYVWEDWTAERWGGGTINSNIYIAKIFQYGDEKARHGVFSVSTNQHRIYSNPVPVNRLDKFTLSVDKRLSNSRSGTGTEFVLQVRLDGEDGSVWSINPNGSWAVGSAQIITNTYGGTIDETEWRNISVDSRPLPVNGELVVSLFQIVTPTAAETHFSNLQFQHYIFLNGSYQKYNGHYNEVTQSGDYKAVIEAETMLGDSPHPLLKGTMFKKIAGNDVRTGRWYAAGDLLNQGISAPVGDEYLHSLGFLQAYALFNQHNRRMVIISGTLHGLRLDTSFVPDLIENYSINAGGVEEADDKTFMLLSYDQNSHSGEWSGTIAEIFDSTEGRDYVSPHTFRLKGGEI